jgi:hypothetical protein
MHFDGNEGIPPNNDSTSRGYKTDWFPTCRNQPGHNTDTPEPESFARQLTVPADSISKTKIHGSQQPANVDPQLNGPDDETRDDLAWNASLNHEIENPLAASHQTVHSTAMTADSQRATDSESKHQSAYPQTT